MVERSQEVLGGRTVGGALVRAALALALCAPAAAGVELALPRAALADEPGPQALPVAVVALQPEDADDQAEAFTTALQAVVRGSKGYSLAPGDHSLEVLSLSLKCAEPPDAACLSRIADQIKADRYLWGLLKKNGDAVEGELNLWTRGKGSTKATVSYSANLTEPNDAALQKVVSGAFAEVTGGPPKATLRVKSSVANAQVFLDGEPIGALSGGAGSFTVPIGEHEITLRAPGHAEARAKASLTPDGTSDVALSPTPNAAKSSGGGGDWRKPVGFVGIGLGAASLAVGVVGSLQVNGVQNDKSFEAARLAAGPNVTDVCATTADAKVRDQCSSAKTWETVQFVTYPVGAVLVGAGLFLVATSGGSKPTTGRTAPKRKRVEVEPHVGLRQGSLDVRVRF